MMVQAATTEEQEEEEEDETCNIEEKNEKLVECVSVCVCVPGSQSSNQVKQPQHRGVRRTSPDNMSLVCCHGNIYSYGCHLKS